MRPNNYIKINKYLNMPINTKNFEKVESTINDVYSFTSSSTTEPSFLNSKSIDYETKSGLKKIIKNILLIWTGFSSSLNHQKI